MQKKKQNTKKKKTKTKTKKQYGIDIYVHNEIYKSLV